ncbi:MAG: rhodanese-like domain-containing protein [Candidatus Binatia bacterium]
MSELARISIAEAKARLMRGEPLVFVDTRNAHAWEDATGTLPHALRVPADDVEPHIGKFPRDATIITYCT